MINFLVPNIGLFQIFLFFLLFKSTKYLVKSWYTLASFDQCWAKSLGPTGNFPASYEPNRNVKISTGHVPISDNVNRKC